MLIQKLRLKRGWSQEQLAELAGLSVRTIQRVEQGKPASMESLKSLASVFEIDFSMLVEPDSKIGMDPNVQSSIQSSTLQDTPMTTLTNTTTIDNALPSKQDIKQGNTQGLSPEELLALRHVRKIKGFYSHLARYVLIVGGLFVLNLIVSPQYIWAKWTALGWGIGIVAHALSVFVLPDYFGADWERRQVEKRLKRDL